jgi:hypothetical protein
METSQTRLVEERAVPCEKYGLILRSAWDWSRNSLPICHCCCFGWCYWWWRWQREQEDSNITLNGGQSGRSLQRKKLWTGFGWRSKTGGRIMPVPSGKGNHHIPEASRFSCAALQPIRISLCAGRLTSTAQKAGTDNSTTDIHRRTGRSKILPGK